MKKLHFLILSMMALLATQHAIAYDLQKNGLYFNLNPEEGTAVLTNSGSYGCYSGDIEVPEFVVNSKGISYDVVAIGENAFRNCYGVTSIDLPTTIEKIGNNAFYGCSGITTLKLPNFIEEIGEGAFRDCSKLTGLTLPSRSYTSISNYLFYGCSSLKEITVPNKVTSIGDYAFSGCTNLVTASVPTSVTHVGSYAFYNCNQLKEAKLLSVQTVGSYAYQNCSSLAKAELPVVESIGSYAFSGCTAMTTLTLSSVLTVIGDYGFNNCKLLTAVTLTDPLTTIGSYAFYGCTSLKSIVIPKTVTSIGNYAFSNCTNLLDLCYATGTKDVLRTYANYIERVVLPEGITTISDYAFDGCSKLNNVVLPSSLTQIGNNSFYSCNALTDLAYADGTTSALRLKIPTLSTITIPETVKAFESEAFRDCSNISRINIKSLEMWNYIFQGQTSDPFYGPHTIYLDGVQLTELIADYGRPIGNYAFSQVKDLRSVTLGHSIIGVDAGAFQNCPDLETVVVGNQCAYIAQNAFLNCSALQTVRLGRAVTEIGDNAFCGCTELNSMKLGGREQTIGQSAFYNCAKMPRLDLPPTITSIGSSAFYGCHALEEIIVPQGVDIINDRVFFECYNLQMAQMPDGIVSVGEYAFYKCKRLREISFGDALSTIIANSFNECDSLKYVHAGTGLASIGNYSFANCKLLTGFYCGAVNVPACSGNAFSNSVIKEAYLYIPDESKELYGAQSPWKDFVQRTLSEAPTFVTNITIEPNVLVMEEGDMIDLTATLFPANATNKKVSWTSSKTSVVYVNSKGRVSADTEGIATITCMAADGHGTKATCTVIVANNYVPLTSLTLDKTNITLIEGEEADITATLAPSNATYPEVVWTSSDERIAVVSEIGRITALRAGACTITCSTNDGSALSQQVQVTVNEPTYASLVVIGDVSGDGQISEADVDAIIDLVLGRRGGVDLHMADFNNDGVVNISDVVALVNTIKNGGDLIGGKLMLLELTDDKYSLMAGDTLALNPIVVPYRSAHNVIWSSSDEEVVSLCDNSKLIGHNPGTAVVKGVANDGSGLNVECLVTVLENPYGKTDGHTWIDLGLPSGTRWATMNVGASFVEQAGYYLAWGETSEKSAKDYSWSTYKYSEGTATTLTKYCVAASYGKRDDIAALDDEDDAAAKLWSNQWRMPNSTQWTELVNPAYTTSEWTTHNGVNGLKVTSKANGNSLFLPAAGYYSGTALTSYSTGGYYASNQLGTESSKDSILNFGDNAVNAQDAAFRCYGLSIRPVLNTSMKMSASELRLDVNQAFSLSAEVSVPTTSAIRWRSSDQRIATVDQNGSVTAHAYGSATIYALLDDESGITARCYINVEKPVISVANQTAILYEIGDTYQLEASIENNSGSLALQWTSDDSSIVTVSDNGLLTAVSEGGTYVHAKVNGVEVKFTVYVADKPRVLVLEDWTSSNHSNSSTDSHTYNFSGSGTLSFDWYVSSESSYDKLIITLDGSQILNRSGQNSGQFTRDLSSGDHTMVVKYTKDGSGSSGEDLGKIYNVTLGAVVRLGYHLCNLTNEVISKAHPVDLSAKYVFNNIASSNASSKFFGATSSGSRVYSYTHGSSEEIKDILWHFEDAGNGCYYLVNELGAYMTYSSRSSSYNIPTTSSKSNAVKIKVHYYDNYIMLREQSSGYNNGLGYGMNNANGNNSGLIWWTLSDNPDSNSDMYFRRVNLF